MSYRTDYRTRALKSTMVKGTWTSAPAGPNHYQWDSSLGPSGHVTPKLKRYLKQKGNRQLRRQHKHQIEQALREHALDLHLHDLHDAWSDFWDDYDYDPEYDLQAQEDAQNAIYDDHWHDLRDTRHDLVQFHHVGLSIRELVRLKGLQLAY